MSSFLSRAGRGGGGGQAQRPENSLANFLSPQLLSLFYSLQSGVQCFYCRKLYFTKDPEGVKHFPGGGGGATFSGGGVQMLISIETHITGPDAPPLWIRICKPFGRTSTKFSRNDVQRFHCMTRREKTPL